jgi:ubiquinone/menaquinone biosynthesis C-methylase UbiE
VFDLLYLGGRTPWDTAVTPPEVVRLIEDDGLTAGRALDLGCGTGTNCIYLARHGWETVGVDFSLLAIRRARRKARRAGLDCRFHRADVSHMPFLSQPFDLVLDIGCLHSVARNQRARYAAEVTRLARPGGRYLFYAFLPMGDASERGITAPEVDALFASHFTVEHQEVGEDPNGPGSAWYWLRRSGQTHDEGGG